MSHPVERSSTGYCVKLGHGVSRADDANTHMVPMVDDLVMKARLGKCKNGVKSVDVVQEIVAVF